MSVYDYILHKAEMTVKKHGTRDPFEILECMKVGVRYTDRFSHLAGYYTILNNRKRVGINTNQSERNQLQTCGHELGHVILHPDSPRKETNGMLSDTFFYSVSASRMEIQANLFSADLMIADQNLLERVGYYAFQLYNKKHCLQERLQDGRISEHEYRKYLSDFLYSHDDAMTTEGIASELGFDPYLIEFKYKALIEKGYELPVEPELKSSYLNL